MLGSATLSEYWVVDKNYVYFTRAAIANRAPQIGCLRQQKLCFRRAVAEVGVED